MKQHRSLNKSLVVLAWASKRWQSHTQEQADPDYLHKTKQLDSDAFTRKSEPSRWCRTSRPSLSYFTSWIVLSNALWPSNGRLSTRAGICSLRQAQLQNWFLLLKKASEGTIGHHSTRQSTKHVIAHGSGHETFHMR